MDKFSNLSPRILEKVNTNLLTGAHPINTIKSLIAQHFEYPLLRFPPQTTPKKNFDDLLFSPSHPSRSPSDSYFYNKDLMLRTHTTVNEVDGFKISDRFLIAGDVYRRDEIDSTHYPVFHQMEGVCLFPRDFSKETPSPEIQSCHAQSQIDSITNNLKFRLEQMVTALFGNTERRWSKTFFPFTQPSFELEIKYDNKWLEVLGCGILRQEILNANNKEDKCGWAFGLGLDRLAMILFEIPDIRLFWSKDPRFIEQFQMDKISKFQSFSKYPPTMRDISFWDHGLNDNDLYDIVRLHAGDLVESVKLVDVFKKEERVSKCFRVVYRSMTDSLTAQFVNSVHEDVLKTLAETKKVELRMNKV